MFCLNGKHFPIRTSRKSASDLPITSLPSLFAALIVQVRASSGLCIRINATPTGRFSITRLPNLDSTERLCTSGFVSAFWFSASWGASLEGRKEMLSFKSCLVSLRTARRAKSCFAFLRFVSSRDRLMFHSARRMTNRSASRCETSVESFRGDDSWRSLALSSPALRNRPLPVGFTFAHPVRRRSKHAQPQTLCSSSHGRTYTYICNTVAFVVRNVASRIASDVVSSLTRRLVRGNFSEW